MENKQLTPQELRAQADAMEAEAAKANKGKVFIMPATGAPFLHEGYSYDQRSVTGRGCREASEAEIQALRIIPEFAARLDKVR